MGRHPQPNKESDMTTKEKVRIDKITPTFQWVLMPMRI